MFILVKEIDNEQIIIGTAQKQVSAQPENSGVTVYEIPDAEYTTEMIFSRIEGFDEIE